MLALPLAAVLSLTGLVEAPLSLTTSDGTGLRLVSLDADAVCGGPVCFTELRLSFENPENRVIEGQFQIALPPGASVSRFAMKNDEGKWQEAEVVEKQAARRAYEDFLHRRQDPALLEQAAGNQFQARVFPIGARAKKELVIGYGHALPSSSSRYVLPLVGLPQVDKLKVRVRDATQLASATPLFTLDKTRFVPNIDAVVAAPGARVVRSEDVVVLRAAPSFAAADEKGDGPMLFLVDTSASRALQLKKDVELVAALLREMAKTQPKRHVDVMAFDQTFELVYGGPVSAYDPAKLMRRRALGATNIAVALIKAATSAASTATGSKNYERVVLVTDGVATADLGNSIDSAMKQLKARGTKRVDAIVRGGVRDEAALASIVRAGSSEGVVIDGDSTVPEIAQRLARVARSNIPVDIQGAAWVWPKTLDGMQPGDERVIVAELPAKTPLVVKLGGVTVDAATLGATTQAPSALLRRAWAEAKIARLQATLAATTSIEAKKEIKQHIVQVSTKHRVLSSETALLILETEADYARYGIDRKSLADILVVTDAGLSLVSRTAPVVAKPPAPVVPQPKTKPTKDVFKREKAKEGEGESDPNVEMDAKPSDDAEMDEKKSESFEGAPGAPPAAEPPPPPPPPPPPSPVRSPEPAPRRAAPSEERRDRDADGIADMSDVDEGQPAFVNPWTGPFDAGMKLLQAGKRDEALRAARAWREEQPGDVLALLLLAEVLATSDQEEAARALGSIIDLFPARTDLRRAVGARLDKLTQSKTAQLLSIDTWQKSVEQRPDHPQSHRGLAWALARAGRWEEAFAAIENALTQKYRSDSFRGVDRILREDLGLLAAGWKANGGKDKDQTIDARLKKAGGTKANGPSLRFTLWWETDSNDVDFHIRDAKKNHAYYSQPQLASGGLLYADVTTGYGPECFTIEGTKRAAPYALSAHYYSRGPMGFGLGTMLVIDHDGKGRFTFTDRPFVIMVDGAFVDLGTVR